MEIGTDRAFTSAWIRARVRKARGSGAAFFARIDVLVTLATSLPALVFLATSLGPYLNENLFYVTGLRVRQALGAQPVLSPDVRLVLADDKSIRSIGRQPTFAEWQSIAEGLFAAGYSRVLLHGFHALRSEIGTPLPKPRLGAFAAGVVTTADQTKLGAIAASGLPEDLRVTADDAVLRAMPPFAAFMGPDPSALGAVTAVGALNILSDNEFQVAFAAPESGYFVRNLALFAAQALQVSDDGLATERGPVKYGPNWTAYIDYTDIGSILARAVPVSSFYSKDPDPVLLPAVPERILAKLAGGAVAILVPSAYTGSRNLSSPLQGLVPAYVAFVSQVQSVLSGEYLRRASDETAIVLAFLGAALALLTRRRILWALRVSAALFLVAIAAAFATMLTTGLVLPCAQAGLPFLAGWAMRAACYFFRSRIERASLEQQLALGTTVQRMLLPERMTGTIGYWTYKIVYRPYGAMAGDWSQVFEGRLPDGSAVGVLAIGDVVGKGPSAALITSVIAGAFDECAHQWRETTVNVRDFLVRLDRTILSIFKAEQNTTLSLCVLTDDVASVLSCGAPAWLHFRGDRSLARVSVKPAGPLGMFCNAGSVIEKSVVVGAGEVLMAYTDGVIDGRTGLRSLIEEYKRIDPPETGEPLFEYLEHLAVESGKGSTLPDDVTLLMVQRLPDAPPMATEAAA